MYALGIDLGTTFTAAATWRAGRADIAALGSRAAAIPSVVLLRQDETFLTGETANRRALTEPDRVAREFKRRLGDPTPILLGGVPYSAEALMSRLLRSVIDEVATREGGPASSVCVCHPANWGPYKTDLLRQAVRMANLDQPVRFVTEPEAAAAFYAQQQRIETGAVVAVYDLGGGTFDAAVLRKTRAGFEILGQPEGIERLGGIDFDAAVLNHVSRALGGKLAELDEDEPAAVAAMARLKEECTDAKEALSSDTDVTIPVLLPNVSTEVRLTRAELESMVRPALYDTIEALKRALRSAGVTAEQLHSVLLVGGSSRMPIVAQLVAAELGRPVAVDAHPKHAVAQGAAWVAGASAAAGPGAAGPRAAGLGAAGPGAAGLGVPGSAPPAAAGLPPGPVPPARPPAAAPAPRRADHFPLTPAAPRMGAGVAEDAAPTEMISPVRPRDGSPGWSADSGRSARSRRDTGPQAAPPPAGHDAGPPVRPSRDAAGTLAAGAAVRDSGPALHLPRDTGRPPRGPRDTARPPRGPRESGPPVPPAGSRGRSGRLRTVLIAVLVLAALAAVGSYAGIALAKRTGTGPATSPSAAANAQRTSAPPSTPSTSPTRTVPADERCTPAIKRNPRWVCLTEATLDGQKIVIHYQAAFGGSLPTVHGGFHLHIYGGDGTSPAEEVEGRQSATPGRWYVEDENPSVRMVNGHDFQTAIGLDAKKVCARIAKGNHELVPDDRGGFHTGNCVPIRRA